MTRKFTFTGWWLTGFTQADGSFVVSFESRKEGTLPFRPRPVFVLTQSKRELDMIKALHSYLGVGSLRINKDTVDIVVSSITELLQVIIPHFDKYTPFGGKRISYLIFRTVVFSIKRKEHTTLVGFLSILDLCYFMHNSSTRTLQTKNSILETLVAKFGTLPDFTPFSLDLIKEHDSLSSITFDYVAGLTDGDGSINFSFSGVRRRVVANYTITMGNEDYSVLEGLLHFFKCGTIYKLRSDASRFTIENSKNLVDKVLPVLKSVHLNTVKQEYIAPSFEVWNILAKEGISSDLNLFRVVDLVYAINIAGKRRKLSKSEYLKRFSKM